MGNKMMNYSTSIPGCEVDRTVKPIGVVFVVTNKLVGVATELVNELVGEANEPCGTIVESACVVTALVDVMEPVVNVTKLVDVAATEFTTSVAVVVLTVLL